MTQHLDDLDPAGLLAAASASVRARRLAEVADLEVVLQWAALHAGGPVRFGDKLVRLGGEGTPMVRDLCLGELALARRAGVGATTNVMADALDLVHRLPLTWARCKTGELEVWVARKIARKSRHLSADRVGLVDREVAMVAGRESDGRVLELADGAVVDADQALHDERVAAERRRRYVGLGRTDEHGLRTVVARVEAGDAAWVDATLTRVAEVLAPRHPDATADEVRAIAFGWLARPADLLQLLLEAHSGETTEPETEQSRATAMPADLLAALRNLDLTAFAPKIVLYVHLHEAALASGHGTARVEGLGPQSLTQLQRLLAGAQVTVKPVLDLSRRTRTTAYEHPASVREQVFLATGGDYWPYATSTTRRVDYDHPTAYDDTGPPGQTGPHNSGPLGRRHHRMKTHAGYRARQCGDGRYVWLSPHGLCYLVDHRGTHRIPRAVAELIHDAPPGVDIYPGPAVSA